MKGLSDSTREGFFELYENVKTTGTFVKEDVPLSARVRLNALSNRGYVKRNGTTYHITKSGLSYIRMFHDSKAHVPLHTEIKV